jgi:acyl-CoA thioester hydrolase
VRSLRKYEFARKSDGKILVKGETDWVFVEVKSGRPLAIPDDVIKVFSLSGLK